MRAFAVALSFVVASGCGGGKGGGDWQPADDSGKWATKGDLEKFFDDALSGGDPKYKDIVFTNDRRAKEISGTFVIENIKAGLKFKGDTAGLWVKGTMPGSTDAGECESTMRFTGPVTGPVSLASGWVWFEQLPAGAFQMTIKKKDAVTFVVFSKATRAEIQKLQSKMVGAPLEIYALESDLEPGRYKTPPDWGADAPPPGIGITRLTVYSKIEATTP